MTTDQIAYWQLQEQKRSNMAQEEIKTNQLAEDIRHNLSDEQIREMTNLINKYGKDTERMQYELDKNVAISKEVRGYLELAIKEHTNLINLGKVAGSLASKVGETIQNGVASVVKAVI